MVKRSAPIRCGLNHSQYQPDKVCKRLPNSPNSDVSTELSFTNNAQTLLTSPLPSRREGGPYSHPPHPRTPHNGHFPDKTQAFQPVAPAWERQTERGPRGPSACSPQPFPSLAPKQMTSSVRPSSYLRLSLPGTRGGGSLEAENSLSSGYFGTGQGSVECQPQPSDRKSLDLILGAPAALASAPLQAGPSPGPSALFCATLGDKQLQLAASHHLARRRRA